MTDPIRNKLAEACRMWLDENVYFEHAVDATVAALAAHDAAQGRASGAEAGTAESTHAQLSQAGDGWQPIETAPKDGTDIFLATEEHDRPQIAYWSNGSWRFAWDGRSFWDRPIGWQPIPDPPKKTP